MGKVKRLELWWQLYITWLPVQDLENFRQLDFCWTEGTFLLNMIGNTRFLPVHFHYIGGMRWHSCLRHCVTSRKVAGLIPDGVTGIFHWHNPSGCTMALELTQPLTETSTRNISWGVKTAGTLGWQPYHLHAPIVLKSGSLSLLEPSGPVQACNGIAFLHPLCC